MSSTAVSIPSPVDGRPSWVKFVQPFASGGMAGALATCVIQPVDMVKVRIQIAGESATATKNPFAISSSIIKNEGFASLYKGLDAAIVRQLTYTTTRLGVFRWTSIQLKKEGEKTLPFYKKAFAGLLAGAVGAFVGTPADLALVRMQADSTLPLDQRRNYKGVADAVGSIVRKEGVTGLWKGSAPTVVRAMSLNMGMLATFDQAKEYLAKGPLGQGWTATLTASAISGFGASVMSLPFDFVKTRIQKQRPDANGLLPYKNTIDCFYKVAAREGPMAFYAGFPTYYARIAPHAMLVLILVDVMDNDISTKSLHKHMWIQHILEKLPYNRFSKKGVVAVILCLLPLLVYVQYGHLLSLHALKSNRDFLAKFCQENFATASVIFIIVMVADIALTIPGATTLSFAGGLLFPQPLAAIYAYVGFVLGACLSYYLVRTVLADYVRPMLRPNSSMFKRLEARLKENAFLYVILARYTLIFPYWFVTATASIVGVPFSIFAPATSIAVIPGAIIYTSAGVALGSILDSLDYQNDPNGANSLTTGEIILKSLTSTNDIKYMAIALAVAGLVPLVLRRIAKRNKKIEHIN